MCSVVHIVLFAFVTRVHGQAGGQVTKHIAKLEGSMSKSVDTLIDKLVDKLFGRAVAASPLLRAAPSAFQSLTNVGFRPPHARLTSSFFGWLPHTRGTMSSGALISKSDGFQGHSRINEQEHRLKPEWQSDQEPPAGSLGRRQALVGGVMLSLGLAKGEQPASAVSKVNKETGIATYCGTAFSPGNKFALIDQNDPCKESIYEFDYPSAWKDSGFIGEIDRTIRNIDGRVYYKDEKKGDQAFVVVQTRTGALGEGIEKYDLSDTKKTLLGFTGGFPDIADALDGGGYTYSIREEGKQKYYDYKIGDESTKLTYLASITDKSGSIYALFVQTNTANYGKFKVPLEAIQKSFRLTGNTRSILADRGVPGGE